MGVILAKFDESGRKISAVQEGWHFNSAEKQTYIDKGYIPITEEENILYSGFTKKKYIRDAVTGKPTQVAETVSKAEKALQIKNQYSAAFEDLKGAMVTAFLNNDVELQDDLKSEYANLMAEYKKELEDLNNGEG